MVVEISTFGSCASRNIFNSDINKQYKRFFHINESVETVTFISLMSEPCNLNETLIDSKNNYDNECVIQDVSKKFLKFLKEDKIDYLIIDTYFDVIYDIIILEDNMYITNSERLNETSLIGEIQDKKKISISKDFYEYYQLWKKSINLFFKFIKNNCENTKVILNCSRLAFKYEDNEKVIEHKKFKNFAKFNKYRDILDKYILEHFDVDVLPFDKSTLIYKNHIFGLHPTHYEPKYYLEKTDQINKIIKRNNLLDYNDEINLEFRNIQRKYQISIMNYNLLNVSLNKLFDNYLTARIDIHNEKQKDNTIEIIEISDKHSNINYPPWFDNDYGKGLTIHTQQRRIQLKIKCIHDGKLIIKFRGKDVKKNDIRIPAYINFESMYINNKKINESNQIVCHDEPYIFTKNITNSEILDIDIYWTPI